MIKRINLEHILFLDIETVPQHENFDELDDTSKTLWELKSQYQRNPLVVTNHLKRQNEKLEHRTTINKDYKLPYFFVSFNKVIVDVVVLWQVVTSFDETVRLGVSESGYQRNDQRVFKEATNNVNF